MDDLGEERARRTGAWPQTPQDASITSSKEPLQEPPGVSASSISANTRVTTSISMAGRERLVHLRERWGSTLLLCKLTGLLPQQPPLPLI